MPDRLFFGIDVDAAPLRCEVVLHLVGDLVPRAGGIHLTDRAPLPLSIDLPARGDGAAPAAVLHLVNAAFGVTAFSFRHWLFLPVPIFWLETN